MIHHIPINDFLDFIPIILARQEQREIIDVEYEDMSDQIPTIQETDEKNTENDLPLLLPEA